MSKKKIYEITNICCDFQFKIENAEKQIDRMKGIIESKNREIRELNQKVILGENFAKQLNQLRYELTRLTGENKDFQN